MASTLIDLPDSLAQNHQPPAETNSTATTRVLHVINGEHYSGAERVQDLLALNLGEQGFQAGFACLKPGRFDTMREARLAPLANVPMRSRFDLRPARELARILREGHYSILHTHSARGAVVGLVAARLAKVPLVHHVHSPTAHDSTRYWQDQFNALVERFVLRGASAVIGVSHSIGEYVASRGIPKQRIHVVPNGVPLAGPLADRAVPSGTWTLGCVALFRERKGLHVLIQAMALLRDQGIIVRLRAVGPFETPEYEKTIRDLVRRLGLESQIDWVGFTSDVSGQWPKMDLFVLPSLFGEGLPMVLLEAMAAGVPVIGTQVEGVPEAVRDEQEGLIVPPDDAPALAAAIARYVRGEVDWSAQRRAAHRRQAERFSEASMAQGVADVYRQVLAERS